MKKEQFRRWFTGKLESQARMQLSAAIGMGVVGGLALLLAAAVTAIFLSYVALGSFFWSFLVAVILWGGITGLVHVSGGGEPQGNEIEFEWTGDLRDVRLEPGLGAVWSHALGSIDTDRSLLLKMVDRFLAPSRLLLGARYCYSRYQRMISADVESSMAVLRYVHRKNARITVDELLEKGGHHDLPRAFAELSLIDGVVWFTREEPAVAIALRLAEELDRAGGGDEEASGELD